MTIGRPTHPGEPALHAVIAVKRLDRAKSRLAQDFGPADRARLVLAMLSDTLRAARTVREIRTLTVVTPDPAVADTALRHGAVVLAEPEHSPPGIDGLNAALTAAAAELRRRHGSVALLALQADLPALRGDELTRALSAAPPTGRAIVVDHQRTGTAALLARDPARSLEPLFGPDSARRHVAAGAVELVGNWPGLRLDVDTAADLQRAIRLGAGPVTCEFLVEVGWTRPADCRPSLVR